MNLILCFIAFFVGATSGKKCDSGYILHESENVCIGVSNLGTWLSQAESTCKNEMGGGVPFVRRMSDNLYKEFEETLVQLAKRSLPIIPFVGMKKDGMNGKTWSYNNGEGSFKPEDYPYWDTEPGREDCGVMKKTKGFKISPEQCNKKTSGICRREEKPCFYDNAGYAEYFGYCLSLSSQETTYPQVGSTCLGGGYILPVKNDTTWQAAAAVLSAMPAAIYIGLKKVNGEWKYGSGDTESERFTQGGPGETDCGVVSLQKDNTIGLFTADCRGQYRIVCEMKGDEN